jgi:acetyl esterase
MNAQLDPNAQALLTAAAANGLPPVYRIPIEEARERMHRGFTAGEPESIALVLDLAVPREGGDLGLRLYHPEPGTVLPLVVYFHGGGWVVNDVDTHDRICSILAKAARVTVLSVDFGRSPENRYPVAIHDGVDALAWAHDHAAELEADPSRIALAGDSAGATVSIGVALSDTGIDLRHLLAFYPVTDYLEPETDSYRERATGYSLDRDFMEWAFKHYLPVDWDRDDPLLFPLRASDDRLAALPSTLVMTAEFDPLRDEGVAFAERLRGAGVAVEHVHADDQMHGFIMQTRAIPRAAELVARAADSLARAVHPRS